VVSGGFLSAAAGGSAQDVVVGSGGELVVSSGASVTGLTLDGGATIDLVSVAATSAIISGSELIALSGGVVVASLGVGPMAAGEAFQTQSQLYGGTLLVATGPSGVRDDFTGDGLSDLLIENTAGVVVVGVVGTGGQETYAQVAGLGPEWSFVETGNFLGDGKQDFLIENTTGAVAVGEVVGGEARYTTVGGLGPEWSFVGAGDFLGDGKDQFLIENMRPTRPLG
jgi:hypothetical protein